MPDFGTFVTWFIVSMIVVFTIWSKRGVWYGRSTSSTPTTPTPATVLETEDPSPTWWDFLASHSGKFGIVLMWVLLYNLVRIVFPVWASDHAWFSTESLYFILALTIFAMNRPTNPGFREKLAMFGMWVTVIFAVLFFFVVKNETAMRMWDSLFTQGGSITNPMATTKTPWSLEFPEKDKGNEDAEEAWTFWTLYSGLSLYEAVEMYEVCREESNLRQFGEDGEPLRSDTGDVGICQTNEKLWRTKPPELTGNEEPWDSDGNLKPAYDMDTRQGNLRLAIWIRNKYGPAKWNTLNEVRRKMGTETVLAIHQGEIEAKPGEWSDLLAIPRGTIIRPEGPVSYLPCKGQVCSDRILYDDKGIASDPLPVGTTHIRAKSESETVTKVRVY